MNDDMTLVREYVVHNSEEAFSTLVSRHVGLVHSAALRQVRDPHQAEEITQTVFIILARKAGSLGSKTILPGWLYRTANYVSAAALKIKHRRERREQEAYMQAVIQEGKTDSAWEQLAPLLDGAMSQLRDKDRDVLVLRFFQNKTFKEVGDMLGMEERAAQKRVARALEKLHNIFSKRGIDSTAAAIGGAISANSVQAAPAALIKTTTTAALAKGATAFISTSTLIKGALKIMAWSKAKTAIVAGVVVLLAAGTTTIVLKHPQMRLGDFAPAKVSFMAHMKSMQTTVIPAFIQYAKEHNDDIPKSMADLQPYLPTNTVGMDDDHWEILATGKLTPQLNQKNVILFKQKTVPDGQFGNLRIIAYTDGHFTAKK